MSLVSLIAKTKKFLATKSQLQQRRTSRKSIKLGRSRKVSIRGGRR